MGLRVAAVVIAAMSFLPRAAIAQSSDFDRFQRLTPLRAMTGSEPLTAADIAVLERAWAEDAWQMREGVLRVIASKISLARIMVPQSSRAADAARLGPFQPRAHAALDDPQAEVRAAAVNAVAAFHVVPGAGWYSMTDRSRLELSGDLIVRYVQFMTADPAPDVRQAATAQLSMATLPDSGPLRSQVHDAFVRAINDENDSVAYIAVQHGVRLAGPEALPGIARRLSHAARESRVNAAMALSRFGAAAKPYLSDLQRAASIETDPILKKMLEGVIAQISR